MRILVVTLQELSDVSDTVYVLSPQHSWQRRPTKMDTVEMTPLPTAEEMIMPFSIGVNSTLVFRPISYWDLHRFSLGSGCCAGGRSHLLEDGVTPTCASTGMLGSVHECGCASL